MAESEFAAPKLTQVLDSWGWPVQDSGLRILAHKEIRGEKEAETPFNDQFVNYSPL